jgi:hypothetical protein
MNTRARWQYFIHDARSRKRIDGPYSNRKAASAASDKFNKQGIPTLIMRWPT